nr:MAG TPA: hypothetical protein [Caudoviricetes sp.]
MVVFINMIRYLNTSTIGLPIKPNRAAIGSLL